MSRQTKKLAFISHTHPDNVPVFSIDRLDSGELYGDTQTAYKLGVVMYVSGTNGHIKRYNPANGEDVEIFPKLEWGAKHM